MELHYKIIQMENIIFPYTLALDTIGMVCFISINLLPAMIRIKRCLDTLMLFIFLQTLAIIPSKLYDSCLQNHPLLTIDMWYFEDWPQICATLHQNIHLYAVCASNAHSFFTKSAGFLDFDTRLDLRPILILYLLIFCKIMEFIFYQNTE